ncbi:MAG: CoA pyrophosphatase [Actinomycetota bacterium]|nr:CoA pyrophosphatase [Actinomycetota bacterium]
MSVMSLDFHDRLSAALDSHKPQRVTQAGARDAAVLIPIVAEPAPTLLFTVRTETLRSHQGQISFPGGSIDATDDGPVAAALRETQEEIGLAPDAVEVLGELDTFPTYVSGYVVTPVVGWLAAAPHLEPNPSEVAEVLAVPIDALTEDIRSEPGFNHSGQTFPTEAWIWEDRVIWGVTARILRSFLDLLGHAGLTAAPGPTTSWTGWPVPEGRVS